MKYNAHDVKNIIKRELEKYRQKNISIRNKQFPLYLIPEFCDEDLNLFEGFLFVEAEDKDTVSYLKTRYKAPVSGYVPRIGIILYDGHLLIKDYRKNKHIIKNIRKLNKTFVEKKLRKILREPEEENLSKLFDRTDIIEEFYILFRKSREFLLKNIKGISEEEKREEFIDNFMMQMLTLWYLQERGFFDQDPEYFVTKFKELKQPKLFKIFKNYYEFLVYLFEKISGHTDTQYVEDPCIGKVVVIGPALFLNGDHSKTITIPDACFYKEGLTDILISTPPKRVSEDVPLFNLFESRDWTEGNIDEFVLGAIYEKLITYQERKKTGAYYTPEEITSYMCRNTIEPFLVDRINEKFNRSFETIDQVIESNEKNILLALFHQLRDIKICDPAVGSAHFLESAINVLVDIYEKIREKAKELKLKKGFEILSANEKGEIQSINLLDIHNEDEFKLLVKFFIILSRNIYGVDINPSALKVAKARLFLSLAKHFKRNFRSKKKDIFIRFPNVHFNLREGNSLIGYVSLSKKLTLFDVVKETQTEYFIEHIQVVSDLQPYLEKTARILGLDGNILRDVQELNTILAKDGISWIDFRKVLRTKEKLTQILIVSLNSRYARPLNNLLRVITDLFNQKLDEKFSLEQNIELEDLRKIKTFHWIFEFPEVFFSNNGFDIVIGNPPYGKVKNMDVPKSEKQILSSIYKTFYKNVGTNIDFYKVFMERSINFVRKKGYFSFLMPVMFWGDKDSVKLRKIYIMKNIKSILHFPLETTIELFKKGINYEVSIFVLKNEDKKRDNYEFMLFPNINIEQTTNLNYCQGIVLDKKYICENSKLWRLPLFKTKKDKEIIGHLKQFKTFGKYINNKSLGYIFDGKLHESNDKKYLSADFTGELAVASNHIKDWFVDLKPRNEEKRWIKNGYIFRKKRLREAIFGAQTIGDLMNISPKLVGRELANRAESRKLHFSLIFGNYILTNSVRVIILKPIFHKVENYLKLLALFNSSLLDWRFQCYSLTYHIKPYEIEEFPIIDIESEQTRPLSTLAKYMLFLKQYQNYFKKEDNHLRYVIDYFDNLIDCLVYELYLGDVVNVPIRQFVEDKLVEIEYYENLLETPEGIREETYQKIHKVFERLEKDKKLNENLFMMKLHPWVETIYRSLER